MRLLREPVVVFLGGGALLFVLYGAVSPAVRDPVQLDRATLAVLEQELEALTGQPADEELRQRLMDDYYRREVLFREGLREGLHLSDGELREAIIERMQQRVSGALPEPAAKDLADFYLEHASRYYSEATVSFEQRFFAASPSDGEAVLARLRAGEAVVSDAAPGGEQYPDYGVSMVRGLFGGAIADALQQLPSDQWQGPWESTWGWHFFRVTQRQAPALLPFAAVDTQVRLDVQAAQLEARIADFVESKKDLYPLITNP